MFSYLLPAHSRSGSNQANNESNCSCVISNYSLIGTSFTSFKAREVCRLWVGFEKAGQKLSQTAHKWQDGGPPRDTFFLRRHRD